MTDGTRLPGMLTSLRDESMPPAHRSVAESSFAIGLVTRASRFVARKVHDATMRGNRCRINLYLLAASVRLVTRSRNDDIRPLAIQPNMHQEGVT